MGFLGELFDRNSSEDEFRKDIESQLTNIGYTLNNDLKLIIVDVFKKDDKGVIVTGTVEIGSILVGDTVTITTGEKVLTSTVIEITMFNIPFNQAVSGDNVNVLLENIDINSIASGSIMTNTNPNPLPKTL